jgi:hypothetical protein
MDRTVRGARPEPDAAGIWIDYIGNPSEYTPPSETILTLAFTGNLDDHEREARRTWGGPLCLTQFEHSLDELNRIRRDFPAEKLGLEILSSGLPENRNVLEISVVILTEEARAEVERRYGDAVEIDAVMEPVP